MGPLKPGGSVIGIHFGPGGLKFAIDSGDNKTVWVWDSAAGQVIAEPLLHQDCLFAEFSPEGLQVVTASHDKTARVWDARTGKPLARPLPHEDSVLAVAFSPDGARVVTASRDKTARVWDARTGNPLTEPLRHLREVRSARFSSDGFRVITVCLDKTVRVWDAATGRPLTEPLLNEPYIAAARLSPDGQRVVTASGYRQARVWELPPGPAPVPAWMLQLTASVAGKRLTGSAVAEPTKVEDFLQLKEQIRTSSATDAFTRWAKWFCADRGTRTISPWSSFTVSDYVKSRIEENTVESLREALRLSPTNGLALARFATQLLAHSNEENPRRVVEADFFSRRALQRSPQDSEVRGIRTEIEKRLRELGSP
jgi:WD40 repeat protein